MCYTECLKMIILSCFAVLNQDTNKKFQERASVADENQGIILFNSTHGNDVRINSILTLKNL